MKESESEVAQSCPTLWDPMDCSPQRSSVHEIFPGKNPGVGCYFLLQRIFPTQGSNPGLPHCRQTLYCLSHQGSPHPSRSSLFPSVQFSHSVMSDSLQPRGLRLLHPWDFPGKILEWAAISFSRGSSQPRDRPRVSCVADRCFTI